jgi:hypothetical protein
VFSTGHITHEQLQAIWSVCNDISHEPTPRDACRRFSEQLTSILGAAAPVFSRDVSAWKILDSPAQSAEVRNAAPVAPRRLELFAPAATSCFRVLQGSDGGQWTPVLLSEGLPSETLVLLPGDWSTGPASAWLRRLAETASMALRLTAARQTARTRTAGRPLSLPATRSGDHCCCHIRVLQ